MSHIVARRSVARRSVACASCEAALIGSPVVRHGVPFCCAGCAGGGPCTCSYDREQGPDADLGSLASVRYCLDVRGMVMAGPPTTRDGGGRILIHE